VKISATVESVISISTVSPIFRSSRFVILLLTVMAFFLPSASEQGHAMILCVYCQDLSSGLLARES
jgi:hypothetical protein